MRAVARLRRPPTVLSEAGARGTGSSTNLLLLKRIRRPKARNGTGNARADLRTQMKDDKRVAGRGALVLTTGADANRTNRSGTREREREKCRLCDSRPGRALASHFVFACFRSESGADLLPPSLGYSSTQPWLPPSARPCSGARPLRALQAYLRLSAGSLRRRTPSRP